jgi:hypothetical protein
VCRLAHVPAKSDPVRRQGHAPTRESTARSARIGSLSDPIRAERAVARRIGSPKCLARAVGPAPEMVRGHHPPLSEAECCLTGAFGWPTLRPSSQSLGCVRSLAHVPAKWDPVRRQGHAPTRESTALPGDIGSLSDPISPGSAVDTMPRLVCRDDAAPMLAKALVCP